MKQIAIFLMALVAIFLFAPQNVGAQMSIEIVKQNDALAKEIKLCNATADFIYNYRYNKDTASTEPIFKELKMLLRVGKEMSRFYSLDRVVFDSLKLANPQEVMANIGKYKLGSTVNIIKDNGKSRIIYTDKVGNDYYKYEEPFPAMDWTIGEETKEILGYTCTRAEMVYRGRRWIAWFAPDIPIIDGPWKFRGLPGLIMEITDSRAHYSWVIAGINNLDGRGKKVSMMDYQYIKTNRSSFYKLLHKSVVNLIDFLKINSPEVKITVKTADGSPYTPKDTPMKYGFIETDIIGPTYK